MARVGIAEAAARLGVSVDTIRRRLRGGTLTAQRDNNGQWRIEVPDHAPPMQPARVHRAAPPYAVPKQPIQAPGDADGHARELVDVLRAQVADLQQERDRLLELVATLATRPPEPNGWAARAEVAEAKVAELQALLDRDLAGLREAVAVLTAGPKPSISGSPPRRRSWLARVLGA